jgi:hypothetical protein
MRVGSIKPEAQITMKPEAQINETRGADHDEARDRTTVTA